MCITSLLTALFTYARQEWMPVTSSFHFCLCRMTIGGKYHGYTSMFIVCLHPHLVPYGLNQWAHTATQLYTNKGLAQIMGRHSYRLDWQAACQGLSQSVPSLISDLVFLD
jgi:hypothetical protein